MLVGQNELADRSSDQVYCERRSDIPLLMSRAKLTEALLEQPPSFRKLYILPLPRFAGYEKDIQCVLDH
jgi:hypothetical protein